VTWRRIRTLVELKTGESCVGRTARVWLTSCQWGSRTDLYAQVSNKDLKYCFGLSFGSRILVIRPCSQVRATAQFRLTFYLRALGLFAVWHPNPASSKSNMFSSDNSWFFLKRSSYQFSLLYLSLTALCFMW